MGNNWPLQSAHPFGAKTKLMILISDRKGSAINRSPLPFLELGLSLIQTENRRGKQKPTQSGSPPTGSLVRAQIPGGLEVLGALNVRTDAYNRGDCIFTR